MNELESILDAFHQSDRQLRGSVLATVVHVKGSSYRRPGARMLVLPDGHRLGTISGGCLESDVARKARWWVSESTTALKTYDTSSEGAAWEFGLGCNGVITLLLEDASSEDVTEQLAFLASTFKRLKPAIIATVVRTHPGSLLHPGMRLLSDGSQTIGGRLQDLPLATELADSIETTHLEQTSRLVQCAEADVFVEWIAPPLRVVAFGAGHDVIPFARIASLLGWQLTIADNRPQYLQPHRFEGIARVQRLPNDNSIEALDIDESTAVVMMTHNYPLDLQLLPRILARSPRYLGMLGPRSRTEKLFAESGIDPADHSVHAPVGLDIGSDHPETIALAIAAEIQSVLSGRNGGSLKWRSGPIHPNTRESRSTRNDRWPSGHGLHTVMSSVSLAQCELTLAASHE